MALACSARPSRRAVHVYGQVRSLQFMVVRVVRAAQGFSFKARIPWLSVSRCPEMAKRLFCKQPLTVTIHVMDDVEEILYGEVLDEVERLQGVMRDDKNESKRCRLCPFRTFLKKLRIIAHLQTYHTREEKFEANSRNQSQWKLAVALYGHRQEG